MVSGPKSVADAFVNQLSDASFWTDAESTFGGAISGLVAGAVLGILTGVIFSRSALLERAMAPFLTFANSLPRPALAPIFILWFGLGFTPKAMVAASVVYFVMLTSTLSGLQGIEHDIEQLAESLTMSARQRFFKIELPSSLPSIVGGLRLGVVYSILGAVLSEMVGAYSGLGQRLTALTSNFDVAGSFAVLIAMGVMTMILDFAVSGIDKLVQNRAR
ncbi:ABC transporter permease [Flexivirga alba]|uniref:ABC transporter permease n=1 Tax=Flexivirga alba TaxID=702742 RepID=A0ABW2AJW2_9MICO